MTEQHYSIAYRDETGQVCRGEIAKMKDLPFHLCPPIRKPVAHRGQRHLSGYYFFATSGRPILHESLLEKAFLVLLDFDPESADVSAQPFRLHYRQDRRHRSHVPDFFVRLVSGGFRVVDVKREEQATRSHNRTVFKTMREACRRVGWEYTVFTEPDEPQLSNIRWLAGFRRRPPSPWFEEYALALVDACETEVSVSIRELVAVTGGPAAMVRPVLFHLLWLQVLWAPLDVLPMSDYTPVSLPEYNRGGSETLCPKSPSSL